MEDSGIGKPRTLQQRVEELERKMALLFRECPPSPNQTEYTAKPKQRGKRND